MAHTQNLQSKNRPATSPQLEFTEEFALTKSMVDRFDEVVSRFPNNTALKSPETLLSYRQLDKASNSVAHRLQQEQRRHSGMIGILSEHSTQSFVANIGVLKAGFIRVDLNVSFPVSRLRTIIEHCGIRCILTRTKHRELIKQLTDETIVVIDIDTLREEEDCGHPRLKLLPTDLTSVNFTSGSTGEPKKTFKNHRSEMHSCMRVSNSIGISPTDRMLYPRSSTVIPFHAMLQGACYCPYDLQANGDFAELANWIKKESITIFRAPVSIFRALANSLSESDHLPSIRLVVLQGEPVFRADVELYKKHFSDDCILVSTLGVSELGDFAHYFVDKDTVLESPTVPGGFPLRGIEVVLKAEEESDENSVGEIGITGPFLSTAPVIDVKCKQTAPTHYTGDVGQFGSDGCLYHHGRKDFQIKVRGNRVNLQELEAVLLELDGISQVAAVGQTDDEGNVTLLAYLETESVDSKSIREQLKDALPAYMIPSYIIAVPKIPRTLTGKINKRELPQPEPAKTAESLVSDADVSCSQTTLEIIELWKDILRKDLVGPDDDFLDLGGDSMKAMMLLTRINQKYAIRLSLRALFDAQTPTEVAQEVDALLANVES